MGSHLVPVVKLKSYPRHFNQTFQRQPVISTHFRAPLLQMGHDAAVTHMALQTFSASGALKNQVISFSCQMPRPSKYCLKLQHLLGTIVSQGHCEYLFLLHQVFTFQSWVCWTCLFLLSADGSEIPYGERGVTFGSSGELEKSMSICLFAVGHWLRQLEIRACKISLLDVASLDLVLFPEEKRNGKSQEICDLYSHFPALQITAGEDLKVPFLSWQNVSRWDMMQFFPQLLKSENRVMNSRECWRNAGATGLKGGAGKIMKTRLMNSCSLSECIVSCSLKKEGSYRGGGKKKSK